MGLLSSKLELVNADYILVLHALELLANETNDDLPTVSAFLINHNFADDVPTYRKTFTGGMEFDDDGFGGTFQKTYAILNYFHNAVPHHFHASSYRECYWLKSEFFTFLADNGINHIPSVFNWVNSKNDEQTTSQQPKPLNSLASFITSYNLPQVTALILGISFEHLAVNQNSAYISDYEFTEELRVKFDKLLQSLVATAESGNLKGLKIAYFEQNNPYYMYNSFGDNPQYPTVKKIDYIKSVIDKANLEMYLKSIGYDLNQLIAQQEPLNTPAPDTTDLEKRLETARETYITQQSQITTLQSDKASLSQQLQQAKAESTAQLASRDSRIAELEKQLNEQLEAGTPAEPIADNPQSAIMDSTKDSYAPDLAYAVNLWLDLYNSENQSTDSHTNRANTWLKKNTGYENVKRGDKSMDRIREIATPLQYFGGQRAKEPKK